MSSILNGGTIFRRVIAGIYRKAEFALCVPSSHHIIISQIGLEVITLNFLGDHSITCK